MLKSTVRALQSMLDRSAVLVHASKLARFPDSRVTFGLGDFTLYRLQFVAGTYVAGFGRAMDIEPQDIRRLAEPT
jgi:hypothetical protein